MYATTIQAPFKKNKSLKAQNYHEIHGHDEWL